MRRYEIPIYRENNIINNDEKNNINNSNVKEYISIIDQLCTLSKYSSQIFQEIIDRSNSISKRIKTATNNLKELQNQVGVKEHNLHELIDKNPTVEAINGGLIDNLSSTTFNDNDRPESVNVELNRVLNKLPDYNFFNKYDDTLDDDQKVDMRYSDPNYFMIQVFFLLYFNSGLNKKLKN